MEAYVRGCDRIQIIQSPPDSQGHRAKEGVSLMSTDTINYKEEYEKYDCVKYVISESNDILKTL